MHITLKKTLLTMSIFLASAHTLHAENGLCQGFSSGLFGNHVCVFNPGDTQTKIQDVVNQIHANNKNSQFGSDGYALLFKQGKYPNVSVPVSYYTQVLGLGYLGYNPQPDHTQLQTIKVDEDDLDNGTSLNNFWRSAENLAVQNDMTWAVSQASSLRSIHVPGALSLALGGSKYASGGFLANSQIDGKIHSSGQQQWLTRNTVMGEWADPGVWNMVFVGSSPIPLNKYPNVVLDKTPAIQEKPFLSFNENTQEYQVIVPAAYTNSIGPNQSTSGSIIPQSDFVIVKPGMSAATINALLDKSQNPKALLFTPGQYDLDATIYIKQDHTVVLGLGMPVITKTSVDNTSIMETSAADVKIAGILFEAGTNAPIKDSDVSLLQIGKPGQDLGDPNQPTLLSDVYCRVGGRVTAQANSCLTINDSYVIGDNLWLWRADHAKASQGSQDTMAGRWDGDQANQGLIVKGHDVKIYGLAVEHFQKNQVLWSGERGAVYFYQSELPYDLPLDKPNFVVPASFKVDDRVHNFEGYGFGIYDFFRNTAENPSALSAIETPNYKGISFSSMVSVRLGDSKGTKHIQSMITTRIPNETHSGPSSAAGVSPFPYWQGEH